MTAEFIESLKEELSKSFVTKTEFEKPRKIYITGDASGSFDLIGNKNASVVVKVNHATMANTANTALEISTVRKAISAISASVADVSSRCTGNSKTANQLKDERTITFTGDVEGETVFDGSKDLIINLKVKDADSAETDEYGNRIVETYAKKDELSPVELQITEYDGKPCLLAFYYGKFYRFIGEEVG